MIELGYDVGEMWLHDPVTAIELVSTVGYRVIQLRARRGILSPNDDGFARQWMEIVSLAKRVQCAFLIDTNASFVIDPRQRELPSLSDTADASAATRQWISDWIVAASELPRLEKSPIVLINSGVAAVADRQIVWERLAESIVPLIQLSDRLGIRLALRPATGQAIETVASAEAFQQWLPDTSRLWLAADVAEMMNIGEIPIAGRLQRICDRLAAVIVPAPTETASSSPWSDLAWDRLLIALSGLPWMGPVIVQVPGESSRGIEWAELAWREWRSCSDSNRTFGS